MLIRVIPAVNTLYGETIFAKRNPHLTEICYIDGKTASSLHEHNALATILAAENPPRLSMHDLTQAIIHKELWNEAVTNNVDYTIAQDNAVLHQDFVAQSNQILKNLPPAWDIILWGWMFDSILHVDLLADLKRCLIYSDKFSLAQRHEEFQQSKSTGIALRLQNALGIFAYTISSSGAAKLMQLCFPLAAHTVELPGLDKPLDNTRLDIEMNRHYELINAYVCCSPLAIFS